MIKLAKNLIYIFLLLFCAWFIGLLYFITLIPKTITEAEAETVTEAVIVLTGGKGRVTEGIFLLESGKAEQLFISGVGQNTNIKELTQLSGEVDPKQIAPLESRITLGHLAVNTKGNALETAIWAKTNNINSIRLVTANYHMPRAMVEFSKLMPDKMIIPHPVFPQNVKITQWWNFPGTAHLIFWEYNKFITASFT